MLEYRAVFDAEITFSNEGGLQAQQFRVDIPRPDTTHEEIARLFVASLDLLMTETAVVSHVRIIEEPHKGTRGGPSDRGAASVGMDEAKLTAADAGEVLALQRAAYVSEAQLYGDPFLPALTQSLRELEEELAGAAVGVRVQGRLIGAVRWAVEGDTAHIGRLTVAPDWQGRGIGTKLLRAAQRLSGSTHFELFTGHLSVANIRLYEREGFGVMRTKELRPGVTLVYMRK